MRRLLAKVVREEKEQLRKTQDCERRSKMN